MNLKLKLKKVSKRLVKKVGAQKKKSLKENARSSQRAVLKKGAMTERKRKSPKVKV